MVIDFCKYVFLIVIAIAFTACYNYEDNIFGVRAKRASLPESVVLDATCIELNGLDIYRITDVQIFDTLMVLKGHIPSSECAFHVFSVGRKEYCGSFIERGRGPEEMIYPQMRGSVKNLKKEIQVNIFDMNMRQARTWNLSTSVLNKRSEFTNSFKTEDLTLNFIQTDSNYISLRVKGNELYCSLIGRDSVSLVKDIVSLYPMVPVMSFMDKLSSAVIFDNSTSQLVLAMMMLPQVNFLNVNTGEKETVAISKDYKKWKHNFQNDNDEQTIYYIDCAKVGNLYLGLYANTSFANWREGIYEPYLHFFDSNGNILFNFKIKQTLKSIAYDELNNCLWGVDVNDKLYCYTLNSVSRCSWQGKF